MFQDGDTLLVFGDEDDKCTMLSKFDGVVVQDNYDNDKCSVVVRGELPDEGIGDLTWMAFYFSGEEFVE